jgi:hypothetical protein
MALIETLSIILTSATAKTVAKFVDEKIGEYIRHKLGGKPSAEVAKLQTDIETLKKQLEAKEKDEVSAAEVNELMARVTQIEQMHTTLPPTIISGEAFQSWSERGDLDIEDQALILRKQLQMVMDRSAELGLKQEQRYRVQDKASSIIVTMKNLREAREKARDTDLNKDKEEVVRLERLMQNLVFQTRDLLKAY